MADAGAITLTLDNRDAGVRHDLQLYGPDNAPFGSTPVIVGPAVASLTIDAAPGSYRFVCTVHPLQMRGVLVVE
jgi:plastocyanin